MTREPNLARTVGHLTSMDRWSTTSSASTTAKLRAGSNYIATGDARKCSSGLIALISFALLIPVASKAESIAVRHVEGIPYGFLMLKILAGQHPAFIKDQGQFEQGGPAWRIELASLLHEGELQSPAGKK